MKNIDFKKKLKKCLVDVEIVLSLKVLNKYLHQ